MGDSDAEWVGVDFEFGTQATTARPITRRPTVPVPATEPSHESPDVERPGTIPTGNTSSVAIISAAVGGVLGLVLLLLVIYMLVLRKRLNKAKVARSDSEYQLRVEDVAHLTNLDETSNTYVNTTDLQKLMSSVRAKKKSEERLPTMPKIQHQTPTPYRPPLPDPKSHKSIVQVDNKGFNTDPDVVVVRAPMPIPHNKRALQDTCDLQNNWEPKLAPETEAVYSNLQPTKPFVLSDPPSRRTIEAPNVAPPPPPAKHKKVSHSNNENTKEEVPSPSSVIARPAPPPPTSGKTKSNEATVLPQTQKPLLPGASKPIPPVAPKPKKGAQSGTTITPPKPTPPATTKPAPPAISKPVPPSTSKPTPPSTKPIPATSQPTPPKPGVLNKGRGLPPLKMALLPSISKHSLDNCNTPDTGIMELTPDNTPTPGSESNVTTGSISSKIAFLEGKMKTPILPTRALQPKT